MTPPKETLVQKLRLRIGLVLMALGFVGFISGAIIAASDDPRLETMQLPLGHPSGIAVDKDGRVYVGSRAYWRISRFNADGSFDRSWHVPLARGVFYFKIDSQNHLIAAISSGPDWNYYKIDDTGLSKIEQVKWNAPESTSSTYSHPDGSTYKINSYLLTVEKTTKDGTRSEAIRINPLRLLASAPIHAWLTVLVGVLLAGSSGLGAHSWRRSRC